MDNLQFGAFIAQLRREQGLTQKELAQRLNVTDKAVSKWETGKGFPDVKLLEPLAQALGVSLVELMQGRRQEAETLTVAEAGAVVSQAVGQWEKNTARRYLRLFRYFLIAVCLLCLLSLWPSIAFAVACFLIFRKADLLVPPGATDVGVIGGADGPTAILTASAPLLSLPYGVHILLQLGIPLLLIVVCTVLAVKVRRLEKKLK